MAQIVVRVPYLFVKLPLLPEGLFVGLVVGLVVGFAVGALVAAAVAVGALVITAVAVGLAVGVDAGDEQDVVSSSTPHISVTIAVIFQMFSTLFI